MPDRRPARSAGEFITAVAALVLGLVVGVLVVGGRQPFESLVMTVVTLSALAMLAVHHLWYRRHRHEEAHRREHLLDRERRGY